MRNKISTSSKFIWTIVFILLLPFFFVSCTNKPELPPNDEAKIAIMEKLEAANSKWASGDPMGFIECAAQDIIWIDDLGAQSGINGREALTNYLSGFKDQIPSHKHELFDFTFQFFDDIVIVNYRYQGTIEEEAANPWKITSVYKYKDGDWLSVHENWSEVKQ